MCSEQKLWVRTHQRLPSSACPVSGQAVPLLQAETLPGMDFLSLADHISCCWCKQGKKSEVRGVLRAQASAVRLQRCKMACGDLHQGGWAGLKASLLGTKIPRSTGESPSFVPWRGQGGVEDRQQAAHAQLGFPQLQAAVPRWAGSCSSSQRMGLAPLPTSSRSHEGKLRESSDDN